MKRKTPSADDRAAQRGRGVSRRTAVAGLALAAGGLDASRPLAKPPQPQAGPAAPDQAPARPRPKDHAYEVLEVGPGKRFASLTLAGCFMNSIPRWNNGYTPPEQIAAMRFRIIVSPGPPGYY